MRTRTAQDATREHDVKLGLDVERFLESEAGKHLTDAVARVSEEAAEKLKTADQDNPKLIRDLQNEIWRADSLAQWLLEIMQRGENAQRELIDDNTEEE